MSRPRFFTNANLVLLAFKSISKNLGDVTRMEEGTTLEIVLIRWTLVDLHFSRQAEINIVSPEVLILSEHVIVRVRHRFRNA